MRQLLGLAGFTLLLLAVAGAQRDAPPPPAGEYPSDVTYCGIFEDNDPSQRLMVVANFDNDVPEYWEWSGEGLFPFDTSNEAYKLGVNYMIYGLTH